MSTAFNLIALVFVFVAGAIALAILRAKLAGLQTAAVAFKQKALLTPNEFEFLNRLESAAPELRFCPQVAMGALLEPAAHRSDRKSYYRMRGMFSQKIVDFVALRRDNGMLVAIIELDDRTHSPSKDAKRDEMLQSAGYRVVRWQSKAKPDGIAIRASLLPVGSATPS